MFSAEHYIKVATVVRSLVATPDGCIQKGELVNLLVKMFKEDNKLFSAIKFINACYTEDWEE